MKLIISLSWEDLEHIFRHLSHTKRKASFCGKADHLKAWNIWVVTLWSHTKSKQVPTDKVFGIRRGNDSHKDLPLCFLALLYNVAQAFFDEVILSYKFV
jgi:hypothetical protein